MNNRTKIVIWLGPDNRSKGGVASVIDTFVKKQYFSIDNRVFLKTVSDTSSIGKLKSFFGTLISYLSLLPKAGLVHIHVSSDASFYRKYIFSMFSRIFGVRYLVHLHSSSFPLFFETSGAFGKFLIRDFYKRASAVLVLSTEMKIFVEELDNSIKPEIFPNPVSVSEYYHNAERDQSFLFLGRIFPGKGLEELLTAFERVQNKYPAWKLLIGGTGDAKYEQSIKKQFIKLGNCKWLGWVTGIEKENLLKKCGVFVLPSYGEGQSISILEAMSAGLPVVTTNVGGNSFLLENEKSGILVAPKDVHSLFSAMVRVLEDKELRDTISRNARKRVETVFEYKHVKDQLEDLYKDLL